MAFPAQSDHRLCSQESFERRIELTRRIEQLGIVPRQNDLQGFRIAEEDEGTEFLIERYRETVAIVMLAAAHKRKWRCNPLEHLQDDRRCWPIGKRHNRFLREIGKKGRRKNNCKKGRRSSAVAKAKQNAGGNRSDDQNLLVTIIMKDEAKDQSVLNVIQQLAAEEHRLYEHEALTDADRARLTKINVELDQCWDLLRQRQALRDAGRNPEEAHVRPPEIVENYEQ